MEIELKFQVPAARRAALERAVATSTAQRTRLQAVYFDTPGLALAEAGLALRLRQEGRAWVQTLKGRDGLMSRLEHDVSLPAQAGVPALDVTRHAGTPAGDALAAALDKLPGGAAGLHTLYRTDVTRLHRLVRHGGAVVELAYDRGHLLAGERRQVVDEIELELKSGEPAALVALAQRWVQRFGLWWDVRPKSEQGVRLALAREQVAAVKAQGPAWRRGDATPQQALVAALQLALAQALPNAAELACGRDQAEHLHQLRVALRRLRAALRLFAPWSSDVEAALALERAWREPFALLGAARDADVLAQTLQPRLRAAGAPAFQWPQAPASQAPGDCVRGLPFNTLLLQTLALTLQGPAHDAAAPDLRDAARNLLRPAWRRLLRDVDGFAQAGADARHRLRKRLKRLRYGMEFLLPLLPKKARRRQLRAIGAALAALGELNDLEVALGVCRTLTGVQPQAWFAVGWLSAQHEHVLAQATDRLRELRGLPPPLG
jgi:inorganic triphosphatase YgiF